MNKTVCLLLIIVFSLGCSSNSTTEKHQGKRDNIINVHAVSYTHLTLPTIA